MRRIFRVLIVVALLAAGLTVAFLQIPSFQDAVVRRMARQILGNAQVALFDENAMRALVCGSASPLADPDRASACIAVFAGGRFYVVDTGLAVWENFALWRIPGDRVGALFFTHFHSDHIADLGEFNLQTWAAGRPGPLRVFGPRGVERLVAGFSEAYALDREYRTAHHGTEVMNPERGQMEAIPFDVVESESAGTVVLEENGLVVRAFLVDHAPIKPAVGYRFDYKGRSVVVSGDTVRAESLVAASKGADVLFHEAQANFLVAILSEEAAAVDNTQYSRILADIPSYHTSPVDAAKIANAAGVKLLVLYHLTPPPPNRIVDRIFMRGVSDVRSEGVVLSRDGLLVTLPGGSDVIDVGEID
jgi:ribonuclease Z